MVATLIFLDGVHWHVAAYHDYYGVPYPNLLSEWSICFTTSSNLLGDINPGVLLIVVVALYVGKGQGVRIKALCQLPHLAGRIMMVGLLGNLKLRSSLAAPRI